MATSTSVQDSRGMVQNTTLVVVYDALLVAGFILALLVFCTAFFSKGKIARSSHWYMVMGVATSWSIPYLLIAAYQPAELEPPFALCLVQSSLIYGSIIAISYAELCLLLQVYSGIRVRLQGRGSIDPRLTGFFLIVPVMAYGATVVTSMAIGGQHPELVGKSSTGMHCNIQHPLPSSMTAILCLGAVVPMLVIEGLTIWTLSKNYKAIKKFNKSSSGEQLPMSLFIRVLAFNVGPMVGVIIASVSIGKADDQPAFVTTCISITPLLAALTFGTQRDILSSWIFWRPCHTEPSCSTRSAHLSDKSEHLDLSKASIV